MSWQFFFCFIVFALFIMNASLKMAMKALEKEILAFWFDGYEMHRPFSRALFKKWFMASNELDDEIRKRFEEHLIRLSEDQHRIDVLADSASGALAAAVLFDQFPRNMYRNTASMFAYDGLALSVAKDLVSRSDFATLPPVMKVFACLPFEHDESLRSQQEAVKLIGGLLEDVNLQLEERSMIESSLDYAHRHLQVIEKFGRFPHRNKILGRISTQQEIDYLNNGGENFGIAK
jgi:uncharacterized protein (DUF924 family)